MFRNTLMITLIAGIASAALPAFSKQDTSREGGQATAPASSSVLRTTVILGLDGISKNSTGTLSIEDSTLVFQTGKGPAARVPIGSIQEVFLSQEDKQVGGTPMALGKAAVPFGGGRVIGLFAHKKYDFVTLQYLDSNGGVHGAICQLDKGQGQIFGKELDAKGVRVSGLAVDTARGGSVEANNVK